MNVEKDTGATGGAETPVLPSVMAQAESSRAIQEVQAALIIAKRFPRDEIRADRKIMTACRRLSLAERAIYQYPKGGKTVTGPSIRMAEMMAQSWGNMVFGFRELERTAETASVEAFAWDTETNTRPTRTFHVDLKMKAHGKVKIIDDPRDQYEYIANMGQRRVRACILSLIPVDVIDRAMEEVEKTLSADQPGLPLIDRVKRMVLAFGEHSVSEAMLEKRLKHSVADINPRELVELQGIYNSLKEGASKREDWFKFEGEKQSVAGPGADRAKELTEQFQQKKPEASKTVEAAYKKLPFEE